MELHQLKPHKASLKKKKRLGRGQGSGKGGTATKGHKGAQARSGYKRKFGFEGGQMPLIRRVPRVGFQNPNKKTYKLFTTDTLQQLAASYATLVIDQAFLLKVGRIQAGELYKILAGKQTVTQSLQIQADGYSATARAFIEKAGGKALIK